jgi:hypothetical protein
VDINCWWTKKRHYLKEQWWYCPDHKDSVGQPVRKKVVELFEPSLDSNRISDMKCENHSNLKRREFGIDLIVSNVLALRVWRDRFIDRSCRKHLLSGILDDEKMLPQFFDLRGSLLKDIKPFQPEGQKQRQPKNFREFTISLCKENDAVICFRTSMSSGRCHPLSQSWQLQSLTSEWCINAQEGTWTWTWTWWLRLYKCARALNGVLWGRDWTESALPDEFHVMENRQFSKRYLVIHSVAVQHSMENLRVKRALMISLFEYTQNLQLTANELGVCHQSTWTISKYQLDHRHRTIPR